MITYIFGLVVFLCMVKVLHGIDEVEFDVE